MTCCADFLDMHPGGAQRLMLAAGGAIDPLLGNVRPSTAQQKCARCSRATASGIWCASSCPQQDLASPCTSASPLVLDHMQTHHSSLCHLACRWVRVHRSKWKILMQMSRSGTPALVVRSKQPFNAETPVDVLGTSPATPNELFYVRNHLPVPHVDPATWTVSKLTCLLLLSLPHQ